MYQITAWGPGYRQRIGDGLVGELSIEVADPTRVLFHEGHRRMALKKIPRAGFMIVNPLGGYILHDTTAESRLCLVLFDQQGSEILEKFAELPMVEDCRPSLEEMIGWVYARQTIWHHTREPRESEFGGSLEPDTFNDHSRRSS